jgi:GNAT superfamily N-acetyltransferase
MHDNMTYDETKLVRKMLIEFSDAYTEPRKFREFGVALRDEAGNIVGGIAANTVWDWLQIDVLWVAEALRRQGHGLKLLRRAEEIGKGLGCKYSKLDTFEFQAREFYERHGYQLQSQTNNFPTGHTHFHFAKTL